VEVVWSRESVTRNHARGHVTLTRQPVQPMVLWSSSECSPPCQGGGRGFKSRRDRVDKHRVCVSGVIVDDQGRVLLAQRADNGHWEPPGGGLEPGETIAAGLRREVREETGLEVRPVKLTGVYKNMTEGVVTLEFRCEMTGGELRTSDETTAFRWATQGELRSLMSEVFTVRVLDALDATGPGSAVRHHDGAQILADPATQALSEAADRLGISLGTAVRLAAGDFLTPG
jgi:8-oxo-dGTP diphosphatase